MENPWLGPCWRDVEDALAAGVDRLLLFGPPGTGKSYAALTFHVEGPVERLVCTEDLTSGDVTGTWMPADAGRWRWLEGPAIRAWGGDGRGGRLVLDEVDRANGDALAALLAVTDSDESARWRHPETGEWRCPQPGFSVVATTNSEELDQVPAALRDRFPVAVRVDRPHPGALARLSDDLRSAATAGSLAEAGRRVSLRAFYAFDSLRRAHGDERAARLVFGADAGDLLDALAIARVA